MNFYTQRIPWYDLSHIVTKVLILTLGVCSTLSARYNTVAWVAVFTTAAVSVTSWQEFADSARKMERYTRAHMALKKLLAWWESLGEVEKNGKENISTLVRMSEAVIADERLAWLSTHQARVESLAPSKLDAEAQGHAQGRLE